MTRLSGIVRCVVFCLLALFAGGCSTVSFSSVLHRDGSATHSLTIMFERASILEPDLRALDRQLEAALLRARDGGYTAERVNTMTQTGIRLTTTSREALDTGAVLNTMYNTIIQPESGPLAPFVGGFDSETTPIGGNRFTFNLIVEGDVLYQSVRSVAPGHRQLSTREGVNEVVHFEFAVRMPGQIHEANGQIVGKSSVRWTIPLGGTTGMTASSGLTRDTPWFFVGLAVLGAIISVIAVSVAVSWALIYYRSRGRSPLAAPIQGSALASAEQSAVEGQSTARDLGSSLARVVERVIGTADDTPDQTDPPSSEAARGAEPQGD